MNVYQVADVRSVVSRSPARPAHIEVRSMAATDIPALAELYLRAYDEPGTTREDAVAEMRSAFDGTWGDLWPEASPVAWIGDDPVAVVQSVRRPSMDDALDCPWLIEVFTDPHQRSAGLARMLLGVACSVMEQAGERRVGLTVDDANTPALTLYRALGFSRAP